MMFLLIYMSIILFMSRIQIYILYCLKFCIFLNYFSENQSPVWALEIGRGEHAICLFLARISRIRFPKADSQKPEYLQVKKKKNKPNTK